MLTRAGRRPSPGDEGAVAVVVAVCATVLLLASALVIDIGLARVKRQVDRSAADASVTAGLRGVAHADGQPRPFQGVCEALRYLRANQTRMAAVGGSWTDGATTPTAISGDPCSPGHGSHDTVCVPGDETTWARWSGTSTDGLLEVQIRSGYHLDPDPAVRAGSWPIEAYPDDSYASGDDGDDVQEGCDHLAVELRQRTEPGLGGLATSGDLVTRVRSVGRVDIGIQGEAAVALLLLERTDCLVLDISGSSGASVLVRGNGPRPGMIHADSTGSGTNCTGSDKVIDGDFASPPRIWAEDAESGVPLEPGVIGVVALTSAPGAVAANAHDPAPSTVFAEGAPGGAPTGRPRMGRAPVDSRYRLPVRDAIIPDAQFWWSLTAATATSWGFFVHGCSPPAETVTASRVFVDCPAGITYNSATSYTATDALVVYNGPVTVEGGSAQLNFPQADKVYVKGSAAAGVTAKRPFRLNHGGLGTCADRLTSDRTQRATLVIGSGPLASEGSAGSLQLCQTAVVLADNTGGGCPIPAVDGLAPYNSMCNGRVAIAGNGGTDWSAPNRTSGTPGTSDWAQLEDLALWTESSGYTSGGSTLISFVQGNGTLAMSGVFFLPNARPFRVAGGGSQEIGENAQFVTRRLEVAGNGRLSMRPDPDDVVTIPYIGDFTLVR